LSPRRGLFAAWLAAWTVLLAAVPLAVVAPRELATLYHGWLVTLEHDGATNRGLSVMGLVAAWTHVAVPGRYAVGVGAAVLGLVTALRVDADQGGQFRALVVASVLIWVVIFNHMAESPGCGICPSPALPPTSRSSSRPFSAPVSPRPTSPRRPSTTSRSWATSRRHRAPRCGSSSSMTCCVCPTEGRACSPRRRWRPRGGLATSRADTARDRAQDMTCVAGSSAGRAAGRRCRARRGA